MNFNEIMKKIFKEKDVSIEEIRYILDNLNTRDEVEYQSLKEDIKSVLTPYFENFFSILGMTFGVFFTIVLCDFGIESWLAYASLVLGISAFSFWGIKVATNVNDTYIQKLSEDFYRKLIDLANNLSHSQEQVDLFIQEIGSLYTIIKNNPHINLESEKINLYNLGKSYLHDLKYSYGLNENFSYWQELEKLKVQIREKTYNVQDTFGSEEYFHSFTQDNKVQTLVRKKM